MAVHLTVKPARFDVLAKRINGLQEPLMIEWEKGRQRLKGPAASSTWITYRTRRTRNTVASPDTGSALKLSFRANPSIAMLSAITNPSIVS